MFYLIPPRGFLSFSTLEQDIRTRFIFLFKIIQPKGESDIKEIFQNFPDVCGNLDCVIEGSERDCASHFIFRLACFQRRRIQNYWMKAEEELFLYRLGCSNGESLYIVLAKLINDLEESLHSQHLSKKYQTFLQQVLLLITTLVHSSDLLFCEERRNCNHYLEVPWTLVQELVSKRKVELRRGSVKVLCHQLFDFLSSLFKEFLVNGFDQLKMVDIQVEDIRILHLIKSIQSFFLIFYESNFRNLGKVNLLQRYADVEREVSNFPLCMQQLHLRLRKFHRLSHHERFRYSLFLKDAGMPLEESINFWKHYYSRPPKCSYSGCFHSWTGADAKRYAYSIRHMYGTEGKRVSYSSYTCSTIQAMNGQPMEAGGCPFRHSTERQLNELLSTSSFLWPRQRESVLKAAKDGLPSQACGLYLSALLHKHVPRAPKLSRFASCSSIPLGLNSEGNALCPFKRANSAFESSPVPVGSLSDTPSSINKRLKLESSSSSSSSWRPLAFAATEPPSFATYERQPLRPYDSFLTKVKDTPKQSCLSCHFDVIGPDMTFFTPIDYFTLTRLINNTVKMPSKRKQRKCN